MEKKLVMLIVDDMEVNRAILKRIFKDEYKTVEAENGLTALEIMQKRMDIDIILLDIMMPKMNGLQLLEKIKKDKNFERIPVIINTQQFEDESQIKALELGAEDFIIKPYSPRLVSRRVRNIVQKSILERQKIEKSLQDTEERLNSLIDTVPGGIGIFEVGDVMHCLYFNDALCELLQYTREELKSHSVRSFILEEDRAELKRQMNAAIEKDIQIKCNLRLIKKNKEICWISLSAVKFRENNGHSIFHAVLTDISEEMLHQEMIYKAMEEIVLRAERDMLTGVYNREKFYKETDALLKANKETMYVMVQWNIDRFKVINDLFGSKVGDKALIQMASRFRSYIKKEGTYGRLEADHFVCCIPKKYFEDNLTMVIGLLHNGIVEMDVGYPIVAHIGIYEITDINTPIDLMCDRANLALQTIKGNYLKRHAYYNGMLRDTMLDEQELIGEMEIALAEKQFYINIQPIFNAETCTPVSAEALVRWRHPTKGIISPGVFIPLFEKNGFITELDMFVWEEVCKVLSKSKKNGIPMVPISVNVSRMNFYSPNLSEKLVGLLKKYDLDTSMMKLEITESAYTDNPHQLLETMEVLQKLGFLVLMDDFGSGYSSLNMLKDVRVDVLKIDVKFMDQLDRSERAGNILTNVIRMAKSLDMQVVAEGVETKNQYNFLRKMSCDCIQGYYFSRPLEVSDFISLMKGKETFNIEKGMELNRETILVVDDSNISRMAVVATLEDYYNILQAENGQEALEVLKDNSRTVDMIITDIMMPVMNGFELLKEIVKDGIFKHIPTVVVTAMSKQDDEIKALELGAVDVIVKPFDPTVILKRVKNLLRLSEAENIQTEFQIMKKSQEVRHNIQEIIDSSKAGICRLCITKHNEGRKVKMIYANRTFFTLRGLQKVEVEDINARDYVGANIVEADRDKLDEKIKRSFIAREESMESLYRMKSLKSGMIYIRFECGIQYLEDEYILDITEVELNNSEENEI